MPHTRIYIWQIGTLSITSETSIKKIMKPSLHNTLYKKTIQNISAANFTTLGTRVHSCFTHNTQTSTSSSSSSFSSSIMGKWLSVYMTDGKYKWESF